MRLNDFIGMITGSHTEYGEWVYWLSVMGTPSADEAWGWQIDGHHLIVNCFVLGDQIVMTPMFMGSEPVAADEGPYAGTRVFQAEERAVRPRAPRSPSLTVCRAASRRGGLLRGGAAQVRYEGSVRSRRRSSPGQISVPRSRGLTVAPACA